MNTELPFLGAESGAAAPGAGSPTPPPAPVYTPRVMRDLGSGALRTNVGGGAAREPATHSLRESWRAQLRRLRARPMDGGPMDAIRMGELLAFFPPIGRSYPVTRETVAVLAAMPSGSGPDVVLACLNQES